MNAVVKLIIGLLVAIAGVYWYVADYVATGWSAIVGVNAWKAFVSVFFGLFGFFLIAVGLLVVWIESEDLKWEREEKKSKK